MPDPASVEGQPDIAASSASVDVVIRSLGQRARAAALRRALRSVISQNGVQSNCIVVFNGDDYDADLLTWVRRQPRTRCVVLDAPDKGAATFIGRALVESEFFSYLDDDDELLPGALKQRVRVLRERPDVDCVATNGYFAGNGTTRIFFDDISAFHDGGWADALLESRNWLASCGGTFRSASVKLAYFQDLPLHREWTVLAFRIASGLRVHFENILTFRYNSLPDSQSKKDSYIDARAGIYPQLLNWTTDASTKRKIRRRQSAAYRAACSYYRGRKNFPAAWRAYWKAIRCEGGWSYALYAVLLIFRLSEPLETLGAKYAALAGRLARNPRKYVNASWWTANCRHLVFRGWAACLYTLPSRVRTLGKRPAKILVFPAGFDQYHPRQIYVAWKVFARCDLRVCGPQIQDADLAIAWNPSTSYELDQNLLQAVTARMKVLNARCTDIRKSTVARHFRDVFGYCLEIDPLTYEGLIVCKSEKNGAHDGKIVQGPLTEIQPGYLYQRLVSFPTPRGMADWRTFIVGQKPVVVYRAHAPADNRFIFSKSPEMTTVEETFSQEERRKISEFCNRIGLDFGNLDILRDASTGLMYISDCNNTVTGPAAKLSLRNKLRVVRDIAAAFRREYLEPVAEPHARTTAFSVSEA